MEELLKGLMGKEIDVSCGSTATFRGEVIDVRDGILSLRDEHERVAYLPLEKIAIVWEVKPHNTRPGFMG